MTRVDAPYKGFPEVSKTFVNEIDFRMRSACRAIEILADYKDSTGSTNVRDHYFGHAAYTRLNAMLFNTTAIVQSLYS